MGHVTFYLHITISQFYIIPTKKIFFPFRIYKVYIEREQIAHFSMLLPLYAYCMIMRDLKLHSIAYKNLAIVTVHKVPTLSLITYILPLLLVYVVCYNVCCNVINLTLFMHAPEGYGSHCVCVCVCVCVW